MLIQYLAGSELKLKALLNPLLIVINHLMSVSSGGADTYGIKAIYAVFDLKHYEARSGLSTLQQGRVLCQ